MVDEKGEIQRPTVILLNRLRRIMNTLDRASVEGIRCRIISLDDEEKRFSVVVELECE